MRYLFRDEIVAYLIFAAVILLVLGTHRTHCGNANNVFSKVASEQQ